MESVEAKLETPTNVIPFESRAELGARAAEDDSFYIEGRNDVSRNIKTTLAAVGYIAYWQTQGE